MIKYSIEKHGYGFPTKILAAEGGKHIYNITLTKDMDNMTLVGRGDWLGLDLYKQTTVPVSNNVPDFNGSIREQAANGNWYIEVTQDTDALLVFDAVIIAEDYTKEFELEENFFNEKGKTVKAYGLCKGDIFEVSKALIDGTPVANKTVTYNASTDQYKVGP